MSVCHYVHYKIHIPHHYCQRGYLLMKEGGSFLMKEGGLQFGSSLLLRSENYQNLFFLTLPKALLKVSVYYIHCSPPIYRNCCHLVIGGNYLLFMVPYGLFLIILFFRGLQINSLITCPMFFLGSLHIHKHSEYIMALYGAFGIWLYGFDLLVN